MHISIDNIEAILSWVSYYFFYTHVKQSTIHSLIHKHCLDHVNATDALLPSVHTPCINL